MDQERLYADLVRDEGKRLTSYLDTRGFWTIGVGHLLGRERRMIWITEKECRALFNVDAAEAEDIVARVCGRTAVLLDDVRQRALVNMAFNRGETNMRESKTITPAIRTALTISGLADAAAWAAVADAIQKSPWAAQIGKRAERLSYMLKFGKDPQ